jgi:hypothetical protein
MNQFLAPRGPSSVTFVANMTICAYTEEARGLRRIVA